MRPDMKFFKRTIFMEFGVFSSFYVDYDKNKNRIDDLYFLFKKKKLFGRLPKEIFKKSKQKEIKYLTNFIYLIKPVLS
jgi:hypothetical protein